MLFNLFGSLTALHYLDRLSQGISKACGANPLTSGMDIMRDVGLRVSGVRVQDIRTPEPRRASLLAGPDLEQVRTVTDLFRLLNGD